MRQMILLAEDDCDTQDILKYNLRQAGFDVHVCDRGDEVIDVALDRRPSLVLLDLMLPGMNGMDVCRVLKSRAATTHIPVIMVTALSDESYRSVGRDLGVADYITKPFSVARLVNRAREVINTQHALRELHLANRIY